MTKIDDEVLSAADAYGEARSAVNLHEGDHRSSEFAGKVRAVTTAMMRLQAAALARSTATRKERTGQDPEPEPIL